MPIAKALRWDSNTLRSADLAVKEPAVTMICASSSCQALSAAAIVGASLSFASLDECDAGSGKETLRFYRVVQHGRGFAQFRTRNAL